MSLGPAIGVALMFVWLGMVLAISFLEAPLKFRAPGVTLQIGLGIGRLVFRALNSAEVLLAVGILIAPGAGIVRPSASSWRPPSYSSPSWPNCWAYGRGWRAAPMRCWPGRMPLARVRITPTLGSRWSR